jgi:hypothetical protein
MYLIGNVISTLPSILFCMHNLHFWLMNNHQFLTSPILCTRNNRQQYLNNIVYGFVTFQETQFLQIQVYFDLNREVSRNRKIDPIIINEVKFRHKQHS